MSGRRRRRERRAADHPSDPAAVPDWIFYDGAPMFVVDFTPGGFPIGVAEEDPGWMDAEDCEGPSATGA